MFRNLKKMSNNLSQNEILKIYKYNKTPQPECTPIKKKKIK